MKIFHCGMKTHNFGDYLNSWLWERCIPGILDNDPRDVVFGIGTILCADVQVPDITRCIHILGSGYGYGDRPPDPRYRIWFVRGPRTASKLNLDPSCAIGDPGMLVPHLVSDTAPAITHRKSFIPHVASMIRFDWAAPCSTADIHLIDPRLPTEQFIASVRASELVVTESLHGAITADSFGVPWIPVASSGEILPFKWKDWLDTLNLQYRPYRLHQTIPARRINARSVLKWKVGVKGRVRIEREKFRGPWFFRRQHAIELCAETLDRVSQQPATLSEATARDLIRARMLEKIRTFAQSARSRKAVLAQDKAQGEFRNTGDLNILCVKWGTKYPVEYVHRLHNMVRRHLTLPHRFICLTDDPRGLGAGIEVLPLPRTDLEYCWNKLILFQRRLGDLKGTAIFFDLDVVITRNIDPLALHDPSASFVGVMDWNRPRNPQFNASVMRYRLGAFSHVIEEFDRKVAEGTLVKKREWDAYLRSNDKVVYWDGDIRYGGDQEWTSALIYPTKELRKHCFPKRWVLSFKKHGRRRLPHSCKVMVFHGAPKPHEVDLRYVCEHWR